MIRLFASAIVLALAAGATAQDEAAAPAAKPQAPMLRPAGAYEDLAEAGFDPMALLTGGGGKQKSFFELRAAVEGLAKSESPTALLDLTQPIGLNLPQLRELERSMQRVKAAGKRIVCYLENANPVSLQLASQCDRVLMAELGSVDFRSPAMSVMHYKDALSLVGVEVEMTRVGEFKGAVEPFVRSTMSEPLKRHYGAMLATMNDDVVRAIAAGRKMEPGRVRQLQAQRLFTAQQALAAGLVDALVPYDGARRAFEAELDGVEVVDAAPKKQRKSKDLFSMVSEMFRQKREDDDEEDETSVVVLHLAGGIEDGASAKAGSMVSEPAVKEIDALAANDSVKGVVVRINSPGGSATASEAIRRALERLAAKKPVVFSMGEVAASGGYWITCIGQPILAEATTITGSIGVFSMRFQAGALMRRLGVRTEIVALDDGPEMDAMDRPWSDGARERMQGFVDGIYDRFIELVATSRNLPPDGVRAIAGGRVWSGTQGVEVGIVDQVGGVDDALAMVRQKAGLGDDVEVRHLPKAKDFAQSLVEQMFDASVRAGAETGLLAMAAKLSRLDGLFVLLGDAMAQDGSPKVYALMPEDLRVR